MKDFNSIDFSKTTICEVMLKISLKIKENNNLLFYKKKLDILLQSAEKIILLERDDIHKIKKLIFFFYTIKKFSDPFGVYNFSDVLWIDNVLDCFVGTDFSLGIIFLYLANKLNLPVFPVLFSSQFIMKVFLENKDVQYINPLNGDFITIETLSLWIKGNISPTATINIEDLKESTAISVIKKKLEFLKIALIEENNMNLALRVCNFLLKISPNDPYEIRDRGLIFSQLNCYNAALTDLTYFIENCPEDPVSEIIKSQILALKNTKIVFH